jgi:non-heme chloroperoxidase
MKEFDKYYKNFGDLFYLDINPDKKKSIVFLHGLGVNSYSWKYQIEYFRRKGYRIIVPDFPGFGRSKPIADTSVKSIAEKVLLLIDNLKLKSIYAVGISGGGCVLLQILLDKPKLISKAIIINSFARIWYNSICRRVYSEFRLFMSKILPLSIQARVLAKNLCTNKANETEFLHQMKTANFFSYKNLLKSLINFSIFKDLEKIKHVDVLIISGRMDNTIPPYLQIELSKIKDSEQIFLDGNHIIAINDYEKVNKKIQEFFTRRWYKL